MNKKLLVKCTIGVSLVILGAVLAMQESIHYREISPLPLSLGFVVLFLSLFAEVGRRVGRRSSLSSEGLSYGTYKILAILLVFIVTFIIIGVIIPLMQG